MEVSSSCTSNCPRFTGSPFSFSTDSTMAETSARRSARFSGRIEPVMAGPEASVLLASVRMSSADSSSAGGAAAWASLSFPPGEALLQAAATSAIAPMTMILTAMRLMALRLPFTGSPESAPSLCQYCIGLRQVLTPPAEDLLPLPGCRTVVLQELAPDMSTGADTREHRIDDARRAIDDVQRRRKAFPGLARR